MIFRVCQAWLLRFGPECWCGCGGDFAPVSRQLPRMCSEHIELVVRGFWLGPIRGAHTAEALETGLRLFTILNLRLPANLLEQEYKCHFHLFSILCACRRALACTIIFSSAARLVAAGASLGSPSSPYACLMCAVGSASAVDSDNLVFRRAELGFVQGTSQAQAHAPSASLPRVRTRSGPQAKCDTCRRS